MKISEIQDLIDFIAKSGLEEVDIEIEGVRLHVKRSMFVASQVTSAAPVTVEASLPLSQVDVGPAATASNRYITIKSPMVGTFYRAPDPSSAPFVQEGDALVEGTKLCIIEAMKLYNEIEAEFAGKIVEVLVEDASPVEYDQPLFLVDPL